MPTTYGSLKTTGTMVIGGALTAAAIAMSGALTLGGNNATGIGSMSGTTLQVDDTATAQAFSGETLNVNTPAADTGALVLHGADGAHICLYDTDAAGWSECDALNGTMTCRIASAGGCP